MIVKRGTPSSTGGAKCISLLNEISMSQLGASGDERANAQHSVMCACERLDRSRSTFVDHADQQVVLEVVADGQVDDRPDAALARGAPAGRCRTPSAAVASRTRRRRAPPRRPVQRSRRPVAQPRRPVTAPSGRQISRSTAVSVMQREVRAVEHRFDERAVRAVALAARGCSSGSSRSPRGRRRRTIGLSGYPASTAASMNTSDSSLRSSTTAGSSSRLELLVRGAHRRPSPSPCTRLRPSRRSPRAPRAGRPCR